MKCETDLIEAVFRNTGITLPCIPNQQTHTAFEILLDDVTRLRNNLDIKMKSMAKEGF